MELKEDKKIVFCIRERENRHENGQGFLRPVFEETIDGLRPVNEQEFLKNGLIHVTKGYSKFINSQEGQFYKVEVNVSLSWDENNSHDGISKYVTFDKFAEISKYLDVNLLIDTDYPDPAQSDGMVCFSNSIPCSAFFISCTNESGRRLVIGPVEVLRESVREESGGYYFKYRAPDKPFGGKWRRISGVSHSTKAFDYDLIPDGVIFSALGNKYLVNCDFLPHESSTLLDLSSDDNIIRWASRLLKDQNIGVGNQFSQLKDKLNQLSSDSHIPDDVFELRKKRLISFPDKLGKMEGFGQILSDFLRSDEGQEKIKNYVNTNRDSLLSRYFEEELKKNTLEAEKAAQEEIALKAQKLQQLKSEINDLEKSKPVIELEDMKQELIAIREEKDIVYNVSELKTHKKILMDEIEKIKKEKSKAENLLEETQDTINQSQTKHTSTLIELKMGLDAISGNINLTDEIKADIKKNITFEKINSENDKARLDVIKILTNNLSKRRRVVNQDDVAILLTCIIQNLIVTLAGKPGSGKSSTVGEIAHVLGIQKENKYAHIQVQRGWSSDRDLLGFYNKLNNSYEPDCFGLYRLINGLQEIPSEQQFSIALLDEANLSSIEHYWSVFMGACDNSDSFSIPGTKRGEVLSLPKGLRFVATVNYDRTTEPLSARFLDRSPVIYIENSISGLLSQEYSENNEDTISQFSLNELEELFNKHKTLDFKTDERRIMEEIIEKHRFIDIGHRKLKAICAFTETLRYVLSEDHSEMLKAFDYAILVYVLPLINGQGREYSKAIKEFNDYLSSQGLLRSSKRLRSIISNSQFEAYSFFS
ncbi:hypothetical protein BJAS_P3359 [Bathymodiolus japonicus methanotrophic gill symbiont]|uniref:hypothetical protein n=2 Tax=Bathymodiolus japonicus methanotrophic gill symbiont TaxID=113269 RepID=UPI001B5C78FE|nr:hypothetical protein [Bathymodiolus japonicus methanotrophic gill symbiont]GFO72835.1 hypothetical protein BJAS_P3359 [Bathymodiolus japonicus methanotrophic gill symbiont]